jgi:hypothetical protein
MSTCPREREFFIDNLLVQIHLIIEMILVERPTCSTCPMLLLRHRRPFVGASHARSWSPLPVVRAIGWAFIAKS